MANKGKPWSPELDTWLLDTIQKKDTKHCAMALERTEGAIRSRLKKIAKEMYQQGDTIEHIHQITTLSMQDIQYIAHLCTLMNSGEPWDEDQDKWLQKAVKKLGVEECARQMERTTKEVENRIAYLHAKDVTPSPVPSKSKVPEPRPSQVKLPSLSEEQQAVLKDVYAGTNVVLLGSAGTGKTTLIRHIRRYCIRENIEIGITGTTGTAAILIEGKTLHSFLGIGLGKHSPSMLADILFYKFKNKAKQLQELKILIIDEVSMLNAELFTKISKFLSIVRKDTRPFGGLQLILSGDFYQLPPVEGEFVFTSDVWEKMQFETHVLTKIYRQEDHMFQELLERAKVGQLTEEDITLLKKCKRTVFPQGIQPTRLFSVNAQVDRINQEAYAALQTEERSYPTICLNKDSKDYIKSVGLPTEVSLKIGAQVMVTRNSSTDNQLVNGTRGTVMHLHNDSVIINTRYGAKEISRHETGPENNPTISYKYMPLKLAWALTIHKGQGTTLDCVEADLGDSIFMKGQAYTALSRVRNLESLRILDIKRSSFQAHPDVAAFYKTVCLR